MAKPQDRLTPFEEALGAKVHWKSGTTALDRRGWAWDFNVRADMQTHLLYKLAQLAQKAPAEDIERFMRENLQPEPDLRPIDIDDPRWMRKA